MFTSEAFLFFLTLLLIAVLVEPLCKKTRIPFPIILVLIGFIGSEITVKSLGIDTGIRWHNFHTIIFYGIIPVLIFQAALTINISLFKQNMVTILIMAFPLMLIASVVTGLLIYLAIDHPTGFPLIAALLTGVLLSATDPAAVLAVLKGTRTPERVQAILEGESLFNDAMAIVLFMVLLSMAMQPGVNSSWLDVVQQFLKVFAGGIVTGILVAGIVHLVLMISRYSHAYTAITLISAYGSYIVAEDLLHVSGVMAVLATGLTLRYCDFRQAEKTHIEQCRYFWGFLSHIGEALIFILAGITITLSMFTEQWLAILFGIMAIIIARFILVPSTLGLLGLFPFVERYSIRDQLTISWGGIRGTVTLALALSLPLSLDYYYTIQSIAYGVVLFTLFVQATTIICLAKK